MTNGVGWACRLETGVATVVEAAIKKVEMKEVVKGGGGSMGDSELGKT